GHCQFMVGNERTALLCENPELALLSVCLFAWTTIERRAGSGTIIGRASNPHRGFLLQSSRTVDLQRTGNRSTNGCNSELRALRICTCSSSSDLCRRYCGSCAIATRRSGEFGPASFVGGNAGYVDDRIGCGNLQYGRWGVVVKNKLSTSIAFLLALNLSVT